MSTTALNAAAKERAWRTFLQNIWIDVAIFVGPLLYDVVAKSEGLGSKEYWITNGIAVGKTLLLVIIAYVMRLKKAPATEVTVKPTLDGMR